jgi:hypothetical protein
MPTIADIIAASILMPRFDPDGERRNGASGQSEDIRAARERARKRSSK